ncbi:hypothetical protein CCH79_00014103 [Gambusia affinis]|uniref:TIR domain-containing protein n=1 Tax=Gambusia affinis TaxID=33528 RepID=A0A315WC64_GAMAF|nr:hypothetical protein CCH79_00014103 [Gambusia affinis]
MRKTYFEPECDFVKDKPTASCRDDGSFLYFISSSCLVVLTLLSSFIYNFLRWHLTYTFHLFRAFLYDSRKGRKKDPHRFRLFDEKKDVLILLFLENIPSRHLAPYYRMRKLVKKRTYLSWPQAAQHPGVFWQNVQRALQTGGALTEDTDLLTGPAGL